MEVQHAVVDNLWNSLVGDLSYRLAVDHLFDIGVKNTVHFFHGLYFLGDHFIVFLHFEDDLLTLLQVFNLVDVAEAPLVNGLVDSVSIMNDGTDKGAKFLALTVDGLDNVVHAMVRLGFLFYYFIY